MNLTQATTSTTDMPHRIAEFLEKPAGAVIASASGYGIAKGGEVATSLLATAGDTPTWIANATGVVGLVTAILAGLFMARKTIIQFLWDLKYLRKGELPPLDAGQRAEEKDGGEAEEEDQAPPRA